MTFEIKLTMKVIKPRISPPRYLVELYFSLPFERKETTYKSAHDNKYEKTCLRN